MLRTLPGLILQKLLSRAGEVLDVSARLAVDTLPCWFAHSQKVRPQTADGVFSDVSQRLAGGGSKHKAPHCFIEARHMPLHHRLVLGLRQVHRKKLSTEELRRRKSYS